MNPVLFTLFEGHYHHGVAALINSAIRSGFSGPICLFHRGPLPPWTESLDRVGDCSWQVANCRITFHRLEIDSYFAYHKPFAARMALDLHPECDSVIYADPDVNVIAPWQHIEDWISRGVAYCLDANFPYLPEFHPWRIRWRNLYRSALGREPANCSTYPNSGFVSVRERDSAFLDDWIAITQQFAIEGGNKQKVRLSDRYLPVVGDQDLMAAALMGWQGAQSVLGPEGMGFNGHYIWLSHDIGQIKPWIRPFLRQALQGFPPSQAARFYLDFASGPIRSFSPDQLRVRWLSYRAAQIISRFWRR